MGFDFGQGDAYRAAGQAIAALLHAAPINHVAVTGIDLNWDYESDASRPRAELLADIAIGLAGVVAEDRYRFGGAPREASEPSRFYDFNESQLADLAEVATLSALTDPDASEDVFFLAFQQAEALIRIDVVWTAIEAIASLLFERNLAPGELDGFLIGRKKAHRPA